MGTANAPLRTLLPRRLLACIIHKATKKTKANSCKHRYKLSLEGHYENNSVSIRHQTKISRHISHD